MGMEETVDKVAPLKVRQEEDFIAVATRTESERLMKVGACVATLPYLCVCRCLARSTLLAR